MKVAVIEAGTMHQAPRIGGYVVINSIGQYLKSNLGTTAKIDEAAIWKDSEQAEHWAKKGGFDVVVVDTDAFDTALTINAQRYGTYSREYRGKVLAEALCNNQMPLTGMQSDLLASYKRSTGG